jgi:hypothetical protein
MRKLMLSCATGLLPEAWESGVKNDIEILIFGLISGYF